MQVVHLGDHYGVRVAVAQVCGDVQHLLAANHLESLHDAPDTVLHIHWSRSWWRDPTSLLSALSAWGNRVVHQVYEPTLPEEILPLLSERGRLVISSMTPLHEALEARGTLVVPLVPSAPTLPRRDDEELVVLVNDDDATALEQGLAAHRLLGHTVRLESHRDPEALQQQLLSCDILIDDLRCDALSYLTLRALALGKTVIAARPRGIREEWRQLVALSPVILAEPHTVVHKLANVLREPRCRQDLTVRGKTFVGNLCNSTAARQALLELWHAAASTP